MTASPYSPCPPRPQPGTSTMSCLWRCLRRKMAEHKLNEIEGVALLSANHSIVTLDATEEDLLEARGECDKLRQIQDVLFSDAAQVMDEGLKRKLKDYIDTKTKAVAQQNIMDKINIDTEGVAQDMVQILDVEQQKTRMEHLLGSVINPLSSHQTARNDFGLSLMQESISVEEAEETPVKVNSEPATLICV